MGVATEDYLLLVGGGGGWDKASFPFLRGYARDVSAIFVSTHMFERVMGDPSAVV